MPQVTFERRQRPPPIRLGSFIDSSVPKYVRTPYPTQPFSQVITGVPSPSNSNPSIDIDIYEEERQRERDRRPKKIYYLAQGLPKTDLSDEISDYFHEKYPLATFHLHCSSSLLALDEEWELCLLHPLLHPNSDSDSHSRSHSHSPSHSHSYSNYTHFGPHDDDNGSSGSDHDRNHSTHQAPPPTKLVQAHHIYIQFICDSGPRMHEWESIAKHIRTQLLSKHEMSDAAIELASSSAEGEYGGHVSAWYPPKLDKEKLRVFFEGDEEGGCLEWGLI